MKNSDTLTYPIVPSAKFRCKTISKHFGSTGGYGTVSVQQHLFSFHILDSAGWMNSSPSKLVKGLNIYGSQLCTAMLASVIDFRSGVCPPEDCFRKTTSSNIQHNITTSDIQGVPLVYRISIQNYTRKILIHSLPSHNNAWRDWWQPHDFMAITNPPWTFQMSITDNLLSTRWFAISNPESKYLEESEKYWLIGR